MLITTLVYMAHPAWPVDLLRELLDRVISETGANQAALAALVSMDPSQISRWKSGKSRPSFDSLERLADAALAAYPQLTVTKRELLSGGGYQEVLADASSSDRQPVRELRALGPDDWWVTTPPPDLWLGLEWEKLTLEERWVWHTPNTSRETRFRLYMAVRMEREYELQAEMERREVDGGANSRLRNGTKGA
jgi:transcriptional regulator with XRE-family HTH domain